MSEFEMKPRATEQPPAEPDWSWYDLAHEERAKRRFFFIGMPVVLLAATLPLPLLHRWLGPERTELVIIPFMWFVFYLAFELSAARWPIARRVLAGAVLRAMIVTAIAAAWVAFLSSVGFLPSVSE
jgi:hypothetical protein